MKKSITYRFVLRADERPINEKVSLYLSLYIPSNPVRPQGKQERSKRMFTPLLFLNIIFSFLSRI